LIFDDIAYCKAYQVMLTRPLVPSGITARSGEQR
jgi:hypothetical protein